MNLGINPPAADEYYMSNEQRLRRQTDLLTRAAELIAHAKRLDDDESYQYLQAVYDMVVATAQRYEDTLNHVLNDPYI